MIDDVAEIEAQFVFADNFSVDTANGGRTWLVPDLDYLEDLYCQYKLVYFLE